MSDFAPVHVGWYRFIVCGRCAGGSLEASAESNEAARYEAVGHGWRVDSVGEWACPECAELMNAEGDIEWVALGTRKP